MIPQHTSGESTAEALLLRGWGFGDRGCRGGTHTFLAVARGVDASLRRALDRAPRNQEHEEYYWGSDRVRCSASQRDSSVASLLSLARFLVSAQITSKASHASVSIKGPSPCYTPPAYGLARR